MLRAYRMQPAGSAKPEMRGAPVTEIPSMGTIALRRHDYLEAGANWM
jgi:hypothetical protein